MDLDVSKLVKMFRKCLLMHFPFLIIWIISLPEVGMREVHYAAMMNHSNRHQDNITKDKLEPAFPQWASTVGSEKVTG